MKLQIETHAYNARRYGKPYIARIDFSTDNNGTALWGEWVGSYGEEGMLILEVEPGDIVMRGQKDLRGWGSKPDYHQVQSDGSLGPRLTKLQAFKAATLAKTAETPANA